MASDETVTLTAEIPIEEAPEVSISVESPEGTVEATTADLAILLQNQQYVRLFERPALSMLSAWRQEQSDDAPQQLGDAEIEDLPTQG